MTMRSYEFVISAKDNASAVIHNAANALREENAVVRETMNLYRSTLTPAEKFAEGFRTINSAFASGRVNCEQYNRALEALQRNLRQSTGLEAAAVHAGGGGGGHGGGLMGVLGLSAFEHMFAAMIPATVGAYVVSGIHKAEADELQQTRLKAILHNGGAGGLSSGDLNAFAQMSERDTMFKKGDVLESASRLGIYQNLKGDQFLGALKAVQDLASVMGTDLSTAATQLGRALEDPEQGMQGLRRAGVILSDEMKEQIKYTFASGDQAKAQAMLIEEINKRVGGTAREMAETSAGAMDRAMKSIGKLAKNLGEILLPVIDKIANATEVLNPKRGEDPERQLAFSGIAKRRPGASATEEEIQAAIQANKQASEENQARIEAIGKRAGDREKEFLKPGDPFSKDPLKAAKDIYDKHELEAESSLHESLRTEMNDLILALKRERKTGVGATRKQKEDDEAWMDEVAAFGDGGFEEAYANLKSSSKFYDRLHESVKEDKKKQDESDREKARKQAEADRYTEHYRDANPWARRERDQAGLESVKDLISPEAYDWQKKEIERQFERSTTDEKKQRQRAAGELQARESGFLVGHLSQSDMVQSQLEETKKTNQIANEQRALLRRQVELQEELNRKWNVSSTFDPVEFN